MDSTFSNADFFDNAAKNAMINFIVFILISLASAPIEPGLNQNELIVWNVGQGLWVTYIDNSTCHHFDIGGEKSNARHIKKSLQAHCLNKKNLAYFSHWDWDHIGLSMMAKSWLPNLCIQIWPQGHSAYNKKTYLSSLGECKAKALTTEIVELKFQIETKYKPNQMSRVFVINDEILLPGDSSSDMEKKWREQISERNQIRILVLGHHGSQSSTSSHTLSKLPYVKAGVSSSNPKRYGHPHRQVLQRLYKFRIPIIKTVSWNSLHFILKSTRLRARFTTKH